MLYATTPARLRLSALLALSLWAAPAVADRPVLPRASAERIEGAARAAGEDAAVPLAGVSARAHQVSVRWCAGQACAELSLEPGRVACPLPMGVFCGAWADGSAGGAVGDGAGRWPSPRLAEAAARRLSALDDIWVVPQDKGVSDATMRSLGEAGRDTVASGPRPPDPLPHGDRRLHVAALLLAIALGLLWARRRAPAPERPPGSAPRVRLVALAAALAWGLVSIGVHHSFPFYAMDMYSWTYTSSSQLVVFDARGDLLQVKDFGRWRCETLADHDRVPDMGDCGPYSEIGAVDRERLQHIRDAPPPRARGNDVRLVRRVWDFSGEGVQVRDCDVSRCRVEAE